MKSNLLPVLLCAGALSAAVAAAADPAADAFLSTLATKAAQAEAAQKKVVEGKDGWLFFSGELRSAGVGVFWGDAAQKVSRAASPKNADPLPAILDLKDQLAKAGVELLLVPVPAKAFVYPEMLSDDLKIEPGKLPPRLDIHHQAFYALLRSKGVEVLDIWPLLAAHRFDPEGAMYCRQDTHWSGRACELVASAIAERYRTKPWFQERKPLTFETKPLSLEINGDLRGFLANEALPKETLPLVQVSVKREGDGRPALLEKDRQSPVVLIGDSHTLVFSEGGEMHARGAGLPDHLARAFGGGIDLVSAKGSGTSVPWIDLARRKDNLKGKRLVIWCFTSRDFTESANGWISGIPVVKAGSAGL